MRKLAINWRNGLMDVALCGMMSLAALYAVAQEKDKSGVNVTVTGKDGSDAGGLVISAQATAKEAGSQKAEVVVEPNASTPENLLGYNVYRVREPETETTQPVNDTLISGTQW